jgi:excisionase family DNA binding protein
MKLAIERLWTIEDVANFCQLRVGIVKYWVRNSEIPFMKLGRQIRFNPDDIREWVQRKRNGITDRSGELRGVR